MSSIPLLHRSSLSLLPLQCCNCNNFLAYILLLISSLLSTLSGNTRAIKRNIHNIKTCPYHQRHHKNSITCNSNQYKNCFCPSQIKSFIKVHLIGLTNFYGTKTVLSTGYTERIANTIAFSSNKISDTYTLATFETRDLVVANKNSRSANTNWEVSKGSFALPTAKGRHFFGCPHSEDQQTLHETSDYCCIVNSNNNRCGYHYIRQNHHVVDHNINRVYCSTRSTLFIQFNTNIYIKLSNITTVTIVVKPGVTAAIFKTTSVDLTHHFLPNTFTPYNNCADSSAALKHQNNNRKPFSISAGQRLISSSLTPLLLERQQSTHSNKNTGLSSKLHVFVQQRKSTSQSRKLPQHLLVDVKIYA